MGAVDQAYQKLLPDLDILEAYRISRLRMIKINRFMLILFTILCPSLFVLTLFEVNISEDDLPIVLSGIGMFYLLVLVTGLIVYAYQKGKYSEFFKEKIIEKLVPAMIPGVSYQYDGHVSFESFKECNLFKKSRANKIEGSDYFYGETGDVRFELSWLHIYSESYVRKTGHQDFNDKRYHRQKGADVVNGVFMIGALSTSVKSEVNIVPTFNELGKLMKAASLKLNIVGKSEFPVVKMGDSEFQKRFEVHSDDENEALRLIGKEMMDQLVKLKTENNAVQVYVSFIKNKVFIAIDGAKGMFEPKIKISLIDSSSVQEIFKQLLIYLNILRIFSV